MWRNSPLATKQVRSLEPPEPGARPRRSSGSPLGDTQPAGSSAIGRTALRHRISSVDVSRPPIPDKEG